MLYLAVLANEYFPKFTSKIVIVCPLIGVVLTTLLCASPVSWLSSRRWSSSKVFSSSILLHYKLSHIVLALNWNLTCINFSDWASFWCIKSSRSTISIASCFSTCCCIYSWLLDFKNIIWRIHITHYFYRVWDAGKTCSSYLNISLFLKLFIWVACISSIWKMYESLYFSRCVLHLLNLYQFFWNWRLSIQKCILLSNLVMFYALWFLSNLIYSFVFYLQSSALGFLLAQKHFKNPLVAVPSAVSVVCMAVR